MVNRALRILAIRLVVHYVIIMYSYVLSSSITTEYYH